MAVGAVVVRPVQAAALGREDDWLSADVRGEQPHQARGPARLPRSPYVQAPRGQGRRQVELPSAGLGRAFPALPGVASAGHRTRLRDVLGVVAVGGPTHRPDSRAWEQVPGALRVLPWAAAGAGQSGRMDAPRATS